MKRNLSICFAYVTEAEKEKMYRWHADLSNNLTPSCLILPHMSIANLSTYIAHAVVVIGVDSELSHLACALGRPNVQIYCGDARY